jgi:hypothetical protein
MMAMVEESKWAACITDRLSCVFITGEYMTSERDKHLTIGLHRIG